MDTVCTMLWVHNECLLWVDEQFSLVLIRLGIEAMSSYVNINYIVFLVHVSPLFFWLQYDYFIISPGQRIVALNQRQKAQNS